MPYQAFPIYDMKYGKVTSKEPWLTPASAFEILKNAHVRDGVLEKRTGYSKFGQMVSVNTSTEAAALLTNPVMGIFTHTSNVDVDTLLVMDQDRINKAESSISTSKSITAFADAGGGEVQATSASHGFVTGDVVTITGTTNYNGTFVVTKVNDNAFKFTDTWVADDATGTANQERFSDLTRHKVRFKHASKQTWTPSATDVVKGATSGATGTVEAVIVDTGTFAGANANGTIVFSNGTVTGTFQASEELQENGTPANVIGNSDGAGTDDIFTGDNTQFFVGVNWNGTLYLTNGNDVIQKYDGTALSRLHIDLDVEGGPDNDISNAKFIVLHKQRLIIFATTESGTFYGYRARWCDINDPDTWPNLSYNDCPFQGTINGVAFLGDDLYVFFKKKTFRFAYTGDEDLPFAWQIVDNFEGSWSPYTPTEYPDEIIFLAKNNVSGLDGNRTYHIDLANPNFVPTWIQASLAYSQGRIWTDLRQGWITFADYTATAHADGNVYPNSVLVLDYQEKNWAVYTLPIHCMGLTDLESDLTWNDITDAWNDIDWSWLDAGTQEAADVRLFGGRDGIIYRLDYTISDNSSAVEMDIRSSRWNPYWKDLRKVRLGWIDFLVDNDENASATISFYKNTDDDAWQSLTLSCDGTHDKVWVRLPAGGEEGEFHRIKIYNNAASNRPRIHAIVPVFKPGGKLY